MTEELSGIAEELCYYQGAINVCQEALIAKEFSKEKELLITAKELLVTIKEPLPKSRFLHAFFCYCQGTHYQRAFCCS